MEKISFYDLLTIFLPGALLTLAIQLILGDIGFPDINLNLDQYFSLTVFLGSSIFLGSFIHYLTELLLPFLRKVGLFTPIERLYPKMKNLNIMDEYYERMKNEIASSSKTKLDEHGIMEGVWAKIYYYLEANDKIGAPKAFQSFYFFFRNFFTLGIILIIPFITLIVFADSYEKYIFLIIIDLLAIVLSILAGRLNRMKMVERMFWSYYSLRNNPS